MEPAGKDRRIIFLDWLFLVFLVILSWLPFLHRAFSGLSALSPPLLHDVGFQWIPFRAFIGRSFQEGFFPLWSPQVFAGFPFAAFSHTGVFYPPGILLSLMDYPRAVNFFYPFQLSVAGIGVYFLARRIELGPWGAFFTGFTYIFTGKPFYFIHFLPAASSNPWIPWLFLGCLALVGKPRLFHFFLCAVSLCLCLLGGDVESTAYGLLFGFLFLVVFSGRRLFSPAMVVLGLCFFASAALLGFVQLLPLTELSEHFVRNQGVTFEYFAQRRLPPALVWAALFPLRGQGEVMGRALDAPYFYLGILTVVLSGYTVLRGRAKPRLLVLLSLFAFLWSFGSVPFLDRFQFLLPLLGRFGTPEHAYFMGQLFLALAAGWGLELARTGSSEEEGGKARSGWLLFLLCLLFLTLASLRWEFLVPWKLPAALFGAAAVLAWVSVRVLSRARALVFFLILVVGVQLLDIYGLAWRFLPATRPEDFTYGEALSRVAKLLDPGQGRAIFVSSQGASDRELLYHAGLALDFDTLDGWITVPLRDFAQLLALADKRAVLFEGRRLARLGINSELRDGRFIDAGSMPVLDLLALRWIVDRGIPLKFSSPYFLALAPAEYHLRPGEKRAALLLADRLEAFSSPDFLPAVSGETYRWRLFINPGDELRFGLALYGLDDAAKSGSGYFQVSLRKGDTVEEIFFRELEGIAPPSRLSRVFSGKRERKAEGLDAAGKAGDFSVELLKEAGKSKAVVPLERYAGSEAVLEFKTSSYEASGRGLLFFWVQPAVVNKDKPFQLAARAGPSLLVYENREALPRAFVAGRAEVLPSGEAVYQRIAAAGRKELGERIFLEGKGSAREEVSSRAGEAGRAGLVMRNPGREVYEVEARDPGYLFVSDQMYPGWRAFVRGKESRIFRADYIFRAVKVPAGKSLVEFVFAPWSFALGLWVGLSSWGFLLGLMVLLGWKGLKARFRESR